MVPNNILKPTGEGTNRSGYGMLGDILIEVGVITPDQLSQAMSSSKGSDRDIAKLLVDLGFTTEEKIMKGVGIKSKVPYFTSLEGLYTPDSATLISEELARRLQVVPLFKIENVATVAMVNPLDIFTIDALVKTTGYRIDPVVSMRTTIFETINKLYGGLEGGGFSQNDSDIPMQEPQHPQQPSHPSEAAPMVIDYPPPSSAPKPAPSAAVFPIPAVKPVIPVPHPAVVSHPSPVIPSTPGNGVASPPR